MSIDSTKQSKAVGRGFLRFFVSTLLGTHQLSICVWHMTAKGGRKCGQRIKGLILQQTDADCTRVRHGVAVSKGRPLNRPLRHARNFFYLTVGILDYTETKVPQFTRPTFQF